MNSDSENCSEDLSDSLMKTSASIFDLTTENYKELSLDVRLDNEKTALQILKLDETSSSASSSSLRYLQDVQKRYFQLRTNAVIQKLTKRTASSCSSYGFRSLSEDFDEYVETKAKLSKGDMATPSVYGGGAFANRKELRKFKELINRLQFVEKKCDQLQLENDNLSTQLIEEKIKSGKLGSKIQFIKDNNQIFKKLRHAYVSMKYNQNTSGEQMVEIQECGSQTCGDVLKFGNKKQDDTENFVINQERFKDCVVLQKNQYENIQNTMKVLRKIIEEREESYSFNAEEDRNLRGRIAVLDHENKCLKNILNNREMLKMGLTQNKSKLQINMLKKLIIKLAKKFADGEFVDKPENFDHLNKLEFSILQRLIKRKNWDPKQIKCCHETSSSDKLTELTLR